MILELKHLAPYLPYELNVKCNSGKITPLVYPESHDDFDILDVLSGHAKPILRPLSDLTKEIEFNGEKFIPNRKLKFGENKLRSITSGYLERETSYSAFIKMVSWHFDVFGLIEKGLAFDINDLYTPKTKP